MVEATQVAIGVLAERRQQRWHILIAKRHADAVLGGLWELPGGKVEAGETAKDCLAREFLEELGIGVDVREPLPAVEHRYDHGSVKIFPFFCTRTRFEPRNRQVAEHRWVPVSELDKYEFPPANKRLMELICARYAPSGDE